MQTAAHESARQFSMLGETGAEANGTRICFQIRQKLDALFDGSARLEETHEAIITMLFRHLETCQQCCRSFDVRAHMRQDTARRIF